MERQDRERRKEEERLLREKQREEERYLREQRRELERREKFLLKESIRVSDRSYLFTFSSFRLSQGHLIENSSDGFHLIIACTVLLACVG